MTIAKVRVENGVVMEGFLIEDIPFPNSVYRADLADWITAPIEVGINWTYDGEVFYPPSE